MVPPRPHRRSVLAGTWYPAEPAVLARHVDDLLDAVRTRPTGQPAAIISPHAGYAYSGPTAATAWAALRGAKPRRIILIGPAHRVAFRGISAGDFEGYQCPLGDIPVDRALIGELRRDGCVTTHYAAHENEHCLEIMLPFLARTCGRDTRIVPLLVGQVTRKQLMDTCDRATGPDDVLVISTDLSHFLPYAEAQRRDRNTLELLKRWSPSAVIGPDEACGYRGLSAALDVAMRRRWSLEVLDYRNSGDTHGSRDAVVGYGAAALVPAPGL